MSRRPTRISSSPRKRGSSIPERLNMNRDAAAYWIARSSRAMTAEDDARDHLSTRRPRAGGGPHALPTRLGTGSEIFFNNKSPGAPGPPFARQAPGKEVFRPLLGPRPTPH